MLFQVLVIVFLLSHVSCLNLGSWEVLVLNSGVSAMHMAVSPSNKVLIFDRTDYGPSAIKLPDGRCRNDSSDRALKIDCWAHSVELDISTKTVRPLEVLTDTWCSSASFLPNGTLLQTGGWNDGARVVRNYAFCNGCDWSEHPADLVRPRWYASNQMLPDGRVMVVGGRREFSYEFVPSDGRSYSLPFLMETSDKRAENNLYPFLHLLPDGNLFIFANSESILFNYKSGLTMRRYPTLPGGARNYPASGSSVMLPLLGSENFQRAEVMVCGGALKTAFQQANAGVFLTALQSCGRMVVTDKSSQWTLETMPGPRVMPDMLNLPTGEVLIINGCRKGTARWLLGREPEVTPVLYNPATRKFMQLAQTSIFRMYHSTAGLLPDGRVLVAGSNPNVGYEFEGVMFPTELRIEAFSPHYLDASLDSKRPKVVSVSSKAVRYSTEFIVRFSVVERLTGNVDFTVYAATFTTHSYTMGQRLLKLVSRTNQDVSASGAYRYISTVQVPPNKAVAPSGYYMLFVVNQGALSSGTCLQFLYTHTLSVVH